MNYKFTKSGKHYSPTVADHLQSRISHWSTSLECILKSKATSVSISQKLYQKEDIIFTSLFNIKIDKIKTKNLGMRQRLTTLVEKNRYHHRELFKMFMEFFMATSHVQLLS